MKRYLFAVVLCIAMLAVLSSCNEDPVAAQITEYSTPTIKGTISIPAGSNVSPDGVYVKVIDSSDKTVTIQKVNSDGTFVIQNLSADAKYKLLFTSKEPDTLNRDVSDEKGTDGVGGWMHDVVPAFKEGKDVGSVKMKPLGTIKGKAVVDGATEHYDTTVYIPGTSYVAMTDKDGNYAIYNVPEGTYTLRYTHEDCVAVMTEDVMVVCTDDTTHPEKTLGDVKLFSNKGTVQGKAVLGDASDSTGITIKLESEDKSRSYPASTSADGTYTIIDVEPGRYRVIASFAGYLAMETDYFNVENSTLTTVSEGLVLLKNAGTISGVVKFADNENDSSGIIVSIVSSDDSNRFSVATSQNGSFTKRVKAGDYTITASYPGYISQSTTVTVVENNVSDVLIADLTPSSAAVIGSVILEGSSDYSGVVVTLQSADDSSVSYAEVTGADGLFRISGIKKAGTYLVKYSKDGYVSNLSSSVDVRIGSVSTLEAVTLRSVMSTVSGKIQLDGASAHENITVLLKNGTNQYNATTDQKGEYRITGVLPGTYTLMASKAGYVTASTKEFVIESSSEKNIELLSLSVAIRSITGTVKLELLSDYAGALVTATNLADSTKVYSAITNSAGQYTLAGMIPGEYSIVISYTGYRTATLATVNVVSSTVTTIPLTEMQINRGTISGVVTLEGRSSSKGITVELLRGSAVYETTTTDESGSYSFYVPQGNYTGVTSSYTDFASISISRNIALFADNFVSMDNTTLIATHNSVYGTVDVLTTDDESAVTISFDGITTIQSYVTESDGSFRFDHVHVGSYTLRFQRQDCSDITIPVEVKAADGINLGTVEITPNTATIKGKVNLKNGTSLSGVKVSVDLGTKILETLTDDSGRYEIGGVSIADEYTVTYSKDGWNSKTQKISPKLDILEVRELDEITLVDTTAPVLSSVVINSGANTTANKNVTLYFTSKDEGSGVDKFMVSYDDVFDDSVIENDFAPISKWALTSGNGLKTLYIKTIDRAGNISNTYTVSVSLTDQKTEVQGTMTGEYLTWTKDNSPYLVVGSVMVESGTTLTIEPGVDVQFAGNYGITVEGTIKAIGTEAEKISFYGIDEGSDNWLGINCKKDNKSVLKYVDLRGTLKGLQGTMTVFNSTVDTAEYALFGFSGELDNSVIKGGVYAYNASLYKNIFYLTNSHHNDGSGYDGGYYCDSTYWYYVWNGIIDSYLTGNLFYNESLCISGSAENNYFSGMILALASSNKNMTFDGCTIIVPVKDLWYQIELSAHVSYGGTFISCEFNSCSFGTFNPTVIRDSNFISNKNNIQLMTKFSEQEEVDLTSNFWGKTNTNELLANGLKIKHSFITDYYADSEFSITKANLSNFRTKPNSDAGYKGDAYYNYSAESTIEYAVGNTGPAGGVVFYDKGYYSNGWRYLETAPADVDSSSHLFGYFKETPNSIARAVGTSSVVGSGRLNTEMLSIVMDNKTYDKYENLGDLTSDYAIKIQTGYENNGYSDWFLPSSDELTLIYTNLYKNGLGGFAEYCSYWSSSECNSTSVKYRNFVDGRQYDEPRSYPYYSIRVIRAF